MNNQPYEELGLFQDNSSQNKYPNLEYYTEQCRRNRIHRDLRDDQFLQDRTDLLTEAQEGSSIIFSSMVQIYWQAHPNISKENISDCVMKLSSISEQYSPHIPIDTEQENGQQTNHNALQNYDLNIFGDLPQGDQIIENDLTTDPKGYIIFQCFKNAIKCKLWKQTVKQICEQEGFDPRKFIEFCKKIVNKKRYKQYSYFGFQLFYEMISQNKTIDVVCRKYFIKYLQDYNMTSPKRALNKALYVICAKQLGQAVQTIQNSFLNGGVQYII